MVSDPISDSVFGTLSFSPENECWESTITLPSGQAVDIRLDPHRETLEASLPGAREVFQQICQREKEIHAEVLSHLLSVHNDYWSDEEEPISGAEFIRRIQQRPAQLHLTFPLTEQYSRIIHFDDGNLFAGHIIVAFLNVENIVEHACFT